MTHDPFTAPTEPASFAPQDRSEATNALELLHRDHELVERLLADYARASDSVEKVSVAERLCVALTVHARLAEELFYPALRQAGVPRDRVDDAVVEHQALRGLIAEVEAAGVDDPLLDARVRVLGAFARRHAESAEDQLFAAARERGVDLPGLGARIAIRRAELCRQAARNMKTRLRAAGGPTAQLEADRPQAHAAGVSALSPLKAAGAAADLALTVLPGGGRLRRLLRPDDRRPVRSPSHAAYPGHEAPRF